MLAQLRERFRFCAARCAGTRWQPRRPIASTRPLASRCAGAGTRLRAGAEGRQGTADAIRYVEHEVPAVVRANAADLRAELDQDGEDVHAQVVAALEAVSVARAAWSRRPVGRRSSMQRWATTLPRRSRCPSCPAR